MTKLDFNGCTGKQPVCHTNQELVQLIRDFKFDMSHFEKVLLHINIQVPYVPK